jgi:hypothetical protein
MLLKKQQLILLIVLGSLLFIFLVLEGVGYYLGRKSSTGWKTEFAETSLDKKDLKIIQAKNNLLKKGIERLSPLDVYIVIDSANNLLYLKKGLKTIREAVISCGSGNILEEPGGKRTWVFDTPRGVFEVQSKLVDPYWLKPDWAFIEEGEKIPKDLKDRIEGGVLGDYALGFGSGYFIHGTLYTRLLGRNVTHGCIRVGDEDLKAVYTASSIGTKVFIF